VDQVRLTRKLGTDFPHAVAQADHVVEAPAGELAEVLGAATGRVDPALAEDAQRVGVKRLGMTAGADRLDRATRLLLDERLGELRTRAVPGAQEQHPHRRAKRGSSVGNRGGRGQIQAGVERAAARREELTAAGEVEQVVGLAAVEGAAAPLDQLLGLKPSEVVGHERLRFLEQLAKFVDAAVAAGQLEQQPPAQRMRGQLQKAGRPRVRRRGQHHAADITSMEIDALSPDARLRRRWASAQAGCGTMRM
jgi:hypothetical protein